MPILKQSITVRLASKATAFVDLDLGVVRGPTAKQRSSASPNGRTRLRGLLERAREGAPSLPRESAAAEQERSKDARIAELERRLQASDPVAREARQAERFGARVRKDKRGLIDSAFVRFRARSFADFGGIGAVDGGYSFYALETHKPERGVLADVKADLIRDKAANHANLDLIEGDFFDEEILAQVGKVDVAFVFDILLHQAAPDWDEVLERLVKHTHARVILIFNPQWTASDRSVRLLDLGIERYREEAPRPHEHLLKAAYETPDEIWEGENRRYRDLRHFWQWGITDEDLIAKMKSLGYKLEFFENRGRFDALPNLENHSFLFSRPEGPPQ